MGNLNIENACAISGNDPVGTTSLAAAACNLRHLDRIANSDELTDDNRIGVTVDTISGFQSKVDIALREAEQSFGFIVAGTFADGFTITNYNQLGQDANGDLWRYRGATLPFTVIAGTTPSGPDYEQIEFSSANGITYSTGTVEDALDDIIDGTTAINNLSLLYVFDTVADMEDSTILFPDDKVLYIKDIDAKFIKITGTSTSNGIDIIASSQTSSSFTYLHDKEVDLIAIGIRRVMDSASVLRRAIELLTTGNDETQGGVITCLPSNGAPYQLMTGVNNLIPNIVFNMNGSKFEYTGTDLNCIGNLIATPSTRGIVFNDMWLDGVSLANGKTGVFVSDNQRRVVLNNCNILNFNRGIDLYGAFNSSVNDCEIRFCFVGINLQTNCHAFSYYNTFTSDCTYGVFLSADSGVIHNPSFLSGSIQRCDQGILARNTQELTITPYMYMELNTVADVYYDGFNVGTGGGNFGGLIAFQTNSACSLANIVLADIRGSCEVDVVTQGGSATTNALFRVSGSIGAILLRYTIGAPIPNLFDFTGVSDLTNIIMKPGNSSIHPHNGDGLQFSDLSDPSAVNGHIRKSAPGYNAGRKSLTIDSEDNDLLLHADTIVRRVIDTTLTVQTDINGERHFLPIKMDAVAASSVQAESLFQDSADNILKWKDSGGTVRSLY